MSTEVERTDTWSRHPTYAVLHQPRGFSRRSSMYPLAEAVGAEPIWYDLTWEKLAEKSWTLGHLLRRAGNTCYGSGWNALVPVRDELRFLRQVRPPGPSVAHFMWGEFASPAMPGLFRRRGAVLIGTFHCSARRQRQVLAARRRFREFDWLTVMSETQVPFFVERGFPLDRIRVLLHGVDTGFFRPDPGRAPRRQGPLRALLVGSTERDHGFAVEVLRRLPPGTIELRVATAPEHQPLYAGIAGTTVLAFLSEGDLLREYQQANLLFMPLLDCTANNAILEAMACGTPVLVNRVGGVAEYVPADGAVIMETKDPAEWREMLVGLSGNRSRLAEMRGAARRWAERISWKTVASSYRSLYEDALRARA